MRKKEPSNHSAPSSRRFGLPKSHILRGRTNFKSLFSNSQKLSSSSTTLRYTLSEQPPGELKMAFISPKKIGTAVQRSRAKRLLREAYRLNQHLLDDVFSTNKTLKLHGAFIAHRSDLAFAQVEQDVITLLETLRTHVAAITES